MARTAHSNANVSDDDNTRLVRIPWPPVPAVLGKSDSEFLRYCMENGHEWAFEFVIEPFAAAGSITQGAKLLGVSLRTVYRWVEDVPNFKERLHAVLTRKRIGKPSASEIAAGE